MCYLRCQEEWVFRSKPNGEKVRHVLSIHLLVCCPTIAEAREKIRQTDWIPSMLLYIHVHFQIFKYFQIAPQYKITKVFEHRLNSGRKFPYFYMIRSKVLLVYSVVSFRKSITYRSKAAGGTLDPFSARMSNHDQNYKFNVGIEDVILILFAEDKNGLNTSKWSTLS